MKGKYTVLIDKIRNSNIIWAVFSVLINIIINFTIVPYVTERVGVEAYGYVTLANTMITYIDVISIAINAFACRFIAIEYHRKNLSEANKYYVSVFYANIILCCIMTAVFFYGIPNLHKFINILTQYDFSVKLLFCLVAVRYFCTLLRSCFEVGAFIKNRLDLSEKAKSISYIIQSVLLIFLCGFLKPEIWYIGLATCAAAFVQLLFQISFSKKLTPELHINSSRLSLGCIRNLLATGTWNAINNLGNLFNSGLDLLIANKMLTAVIAGMISVSKTLGSTCYTVVCAISNSFRPKQLELYSVGDIDGLLNLLKKSMRITGAFCGVVIAGFWACGIDFLSLWIPSQNIEMIFQLTVIVLLGDIMIGVVNPLYYVFTLTKKLMLPCIITIAMGIVNIVSMYFLIKYTSYGDYAVVVTTMVINLIHFVDTPIYAAYCLQRPLKTFYPTILRHLVCVSILCIITTMLNLIYPSVTTWLSLGVKIFIFGIVELIFAFFVIADRNEQIHLVNVICRR